MVAVAQSAAHLSVLAVVELEQEQVQGFFRASVSSPAFSFLTAIFPYCTHLHNSLGFKTLIYPGFIGEIFVVVAFKL